MRVLHVVPTYLPAWRYGGPIHSVHGLCKSLARLGVEVDVATTTVDGDATLQVPVGVPVDRDGVGVRYFESPRLRRLYWSPGLARHLRAHLREYDLLHLHSVFLWPTSYAARIARAHGVPYVLSPRGMLVDTLIRRRNRWIKLAWINLFEKRNLRAAAMVHFTSEIEASDAAALGLEWPGHCVIPNGVDLEPGPGEEQVNTTGIAFGGQPYVMFLGRLNWKKGLDRLISGMARIPEASLLIAGNDEDGYEKTLDALAAREGLRERVRFAGAVEGAAKRDLLRRASVLVLASYSENFGNVVLEAMAEGCPVIVTPEVGAAAIVEQSGAGLVVSGEPEPLAAAIRRLLEDGELRAAMGRRGRETAAGYGWNVIARKMAERYEAVLQDRHRAAA
jgi:glycosyltransferase involved in cell wall biosynthesis